MKNKPHESNRKKKYIILCLTIVIFLAVFFFGSFYIGRFTGLDFWSVPKILFSKIFRSVYKELHADRETGC